MNKERSTTELPSTELLSINLQIEGMSCASCAGKVEKALTSLLGVTQV